jgi:hypothetical protein
LVAVCIAAATSGCTYVSLTHFYDQVPAATPIAIDPIGGYLLLYWIDEQGAACHGSPGISGQPGPAALSVARPPAIQDAVAVASIPASRLADYQFIAYNLGDYSTTNASGLHFFQFDNLLWRQRSNGQGFRDSASHHYSAPQVIDIGNRPPTIYPVYAWGHQDCEQSEFIATGDPLQEQPSQHPTQCRRRALPASSAVPEGGPFAYCLKRLPEGSRYVAY